ncbi:MAG TPA: autotransporter assembly complex family protein, partial [Paenirhodobacter sp.]
FLAAARSDYERLLSALYSEGYYSGVISILVDGREAASVAPLDAPKTVSKIAISVDPGPRFRFSRTAIGPTAKRTTLPGGFRIGEIARSEEIVSAARAGVTAWRNEGHARAEVRDQQITADHRTNTLSADIPLAPGPLVHFGEVRVTGNQRVRMTRLLRIAGFPTGEIYSPEKAEKVVRRLRRTGVFSSVSLTEAENLGPGDTLDYDLALVEGKRRRLNFGAEVSSTEGVSLSGYWMHRNLFGGAENLKISGAISGIGGQTGGTDYTLGTRIERPGTPFADNLAFAEVIAKKGNEDDYTVESLGFSIGLTRYITDTLTGEIAVGIENQRITDDFGQTTYRQLTLPFSLAWDRRDNILNPKDGFYLKGGIMPYIGLQTTGNGAKATLDARGYEGFVDNRIVIAARIQAGTIFGTDLHDTPRDYLFYSGGGGTVRGQPYQSLAVTPDPGKPRTGGTNFFGTSLEVRGDVTESIGLAAFYDAGYISDGDFVSGNGEWQSGAGIGGRYYTAIGPIRFDVATPVSGNTGDGIQFYIGIGQAF